jgi:hypothetical protein
MREQTPSSEFHSLQNEASLRQPTQIRQLTKQLTKRITKTSFCHATKMCMVYSLPCMHCSPPSVYLPKICNRGSHVSGTFRQWADTIGGLRDSNMRCHSELHIRFRVRIRLSPHSFGSSKYRRLMLFAAIQDPWGEQIAIGGIHRTI